MNFSFGSTKPIPTEKLPPELVARLRSGAPPSEEDLAQVRSALAGEAGFAGTVLDALAGAGLVRREPADGDDVAFDDAGLPAELATDPDVRVVPLSAERFEWTPGRGFTLDAEGGFEPATYYEAFTGRPDPAREFFVGMRRWMSIVTTGIAIGLPIVLVTGAILTNQAPDTIFFAGFFGLIIAIMLKTSMPKSPFD